MFYDVDLNRLGVKELGKPLPSKVELAAGEVPAGAVRYQLLVWDAEGRQDRTSLADIP